MWNSTNLSKQPSRTGHLDWILRQRGVRFLMYSRGIGCRDVGRPSIVSRRRHSLVQHGMSITEQVIKSRSSLFPTKLDIAPVLIDNEKDVRFKSALSQDSFISLIPWSGADDGGGSPGLRLLKCFRRSIFCGVGIRHTKPLFCSSGLLVFDCCGR